MRPPASVCSLNAYTAGSLARALELRDPDAVSDKEGIARNIEGGSVLQGCELNGVVQFVETVDLHRVNDDAQGLRGALGLLYLQPGTRVR